VSGSKAEKRKWVKRFKTGHGVPIKLSVSQRVNKELEFLVEEGFYLSKNDAIRDALNFFFHVRPWEKRITGRTSLHELLE